MFAGNSRSNLWWKIFGNLVAGIACVLAVAVEANEERGQVYPLSDWGEHFRHALTEKTIRVPGDWRARYVVPPPPGGVRETANELIELEALKPLRLTRQAAIEAYREELVAPFLSALNCTRDRVPGLVNLIDDIQVDALIVVMHFKLKFSRLRPSQIDPSIEPSIEPPKHPSYPSGHATQAYATAYVLREILGKDNERVRKVAEEIAQDREVAGVHYRSDTIAGKILALQIAEDYRRTTDLSGYRDQIGRCR